MSHPMLQVSFMLLIPLPSRHISAGGMKAAEQKKVIRSPYVNLALRNKLSKWSTSKEGDKTLDNSRKNEIPKSKLQGKKTSEKKVKLVQRKKKQKRYKKSWKKSKKNKRKFKKENVLKKTKLRQYKRKSRKVCNEPDLCEKIKSYIKFSNSLRQVKRTKSACKIMDRKWTKAETVFVATVASLNYVLDSRSGRRLYLLMSRWRQSSRSSNEVIEIRDKLENCSITAKAKCQTSTVEACQNETLLNHCEDALQKWINEFGPAKGSCLQSSDNCCACLNNLTIESVRGCTQFSPISKAAVASKKNCTSSGVEGSFGYCRKLQYLAAEKGPGAATCPATGTTPVMTTRRIPRTTGKFTNMTTSTSTTPYPIKCGVKKQETKIVGGAVTSVNWYPWLAHLSTGCSGSVITANWILTAAHCFFNATTGEKTTDNSNIGTISVIIGEHDLSVTTETTITKKLTPDKLIVHPEYDHSEDRLNDIALVRVPAIDLWVYTPVCLPQQGEDYSGKKAWIYGWGAWQSGESSSSKLQELEMVVLNDAKAKQQYIIEAGKWLSDEKLDVMVFAEGEAGKEVCQVDSGGPFTYGKPDNNGSHELVGIVSWGFGCGEKGLPGAYAQVSAFRTWINKEINYTFVNSAIWR